ncbi:MAG: hypothetical protein RQ760_04400 [Sedimentisphaerales bacterium]|nr:hypothetical protein [Sedimentisphaerales bacterium]
MIKTLRIMSILAVALAAVLVVFSVVVFGARGDKDIEELLGEPGVIEKFNNSAGNKSTRGTNEVSPLVQQAGAFALYLNPPEPPAPRSVKGRPPTIKRAPSATPKFKVMGTSYYKGHPESSMALIDEPGKGLHWVRQSSMVGHLLIQEVKDGIVVVKDNSGTFELKAEETPHISLIEGASAVPSKPADVSKSPVSRAVSGSSSAASAKSSTVYSGKTGSGYVTPRPPLPRKTNEQESAMKELTDKLAQLQKSFKSDKSGTGPSAQEKAEMMNKLISEFQASKASRLSAEESERLSILGKELRKKMEEPTSSDQK